LSGVGPQENLDVALGAAMAVLPSGLYSLAVGVALIVLAFRLWGLRRGRGLQGDLNPRGGNE
jgi:hypothetical protein